MDRVIVTGGEGFNGSTLVHCLVDMREIHVLNIDQLAYAGHLNSLTPIMSSPHLCFLQADIGDKEARRQAFLDFKPDTVLHLAAESHVDRSIEGPDTFVRTNVVGTCALLEAALEYRRELAGSAKDRFRFVQVSTDEVFGALGPDGFFGKLALSLARLRQRPECARLDPSRRPCAR